jgi:hypothetical protein
MNTRPPRSTTAPTTRINFRSPPPPVHIAAANAADSARRPGARSSGSELLRDKPAAIAVAGAQNPAAAGSMAASTHRQAVHLRISSCARTHRPPFFQLGSAHYAAAVRVYECDMKCVCTCMICCACACMQRTCTYSMHSRRQRCTQHSRHTQTACIPPHIIHTAHLGDHSG